MNKKILFLLFVSIGNVVGSILVYLLFGGTNVPEYIALYTSILTASYAILAEPKVRTEPYLRISPVLRRYGHILIGNANSPSSSGLNARIENVGYSNAKNIEVRCRLVPDSSIPLKNNGIFKHPLLTPKDDPIIYKIVEFAESNKLRSQQLIVEASYSNEDDKKQEPIKMKVAISELEED